MTLPAEPGASTEEPAAVYFFEDLTVKGEAPEDSRRPHLSFMDSAAITYGFSPLASVEDSVDADLQLELDSLTLDDSFGTDEFAERYLPEPPPVNPDRIELPRVPMDGVPSVVQYMVPIVHGPNLLLSTVESNWNAPSEISLAHEEVFDGVVDVIDGDTLNGADSVAYGWGRWGWIALEFLPQAKGVPRGTPSSTSPAPGGVGTAAAGGGGKKVTGPDTMSPGPFARESIPARSKAQRFRKAERERINEIGNKHGCHTCGARTSGRKSGNWTPDHQPVSKTVPDGVFQSLYPHCKTCSAIQGGYVSHL